jgi:hypothetical protein
MDWHKRMMGVLVLRYPSMETRLKINPLTSFICFSLLVFIYRHDIISS